MTRRGALQATAFCSARLASVQAQPPFSTGKERDAETGLNYFGARYFSAAQGRWTSPDWSAKPQPVHFKNPQTLNLFAYVGNNPLARMDPDGHYECSESTKGQCATIRSALDTVRKAAGSLKVGTKGRTRLDNLLQFYGKEGEKNGVKVNFADLGGGAVGMTATEHKITTIAFDTDAMKSHFGAAGTAPTRGHTGWTSKGSACLERFGSSTIRSITRIRASHTLTRDSSAGRSPTATARYGLPGCHTHNTLAI